MAGVDPYRIPDDGILRVINFSGGRSSAYMLYHILKAHGGKLPENAIACFANTGAELEETLVFVHECEKRWSVPVVWLEYRHFREARGGRPGEYKHSHEVVSFETASRNYEPYEARIFVSGTLPSTVRPTCTRDLKIDPIRFHVQRDLGLGVKGRYINIIGIRYDEKRRVQKALMEECKTDYPMYHAKTTREDVLKFWGKQDFDLSLDNYSIQGNCNLCFKKSRPKLELLIRNKPSLADWWLRMEEEVSEMRDYQVTFNKEWSYRELKESALVPDWTPPQGTTKKTLEEIDCFCGD